MKVGEHALIGRRFHIINAEQINRFEDVNDEINFKDEDIINEDNKLFVALVDMLQRKKMINKPTFAKVMKSLGGRL